MTDIAMEAQTTACPQEGCIRPYPHEGVRHRFAPTKELQAPAAPAPEPELPPIIRPASVDMAKRPFAGPIEDQPRHHAVSIVDDGLHVAWDHCWSCKKHITRCGCLTGPMEPVYITRWRTKQFPVAGDVPAESLAPAQQSGILPPDHEDDVELVELTHTMTSLPTSPVVEEPVVEEPVETTATEGTHYCTNCLAELYLKDDGDGPRAYTVDGDENSCPDSEVGLHFAVEHGEEPTPAADPEPQPDPDVSWPAQPDLPTDVHTDTDTDTSTIDPEVGF